MTILYQVRKDIYYKIRIWERANDSDFRSHVIVNVKLIKCMLLVSRVENLDMFALYFLGKPSSIYDKDNPGWVPSQKLGNCEEELPKKPVGRLLADCRPTGFPQNIDYQSADKRPTVGRQLVMCR